MDSLLERESRDPVRIQKSFRRGLGLLTTPEQIRPHIVGTVREALNVPVAALFVLDDDSNVFIPAIVQGFHPKERSTFTFEDALISWMNVNRRHVNFKRDNRLLERGKPDEKERWGHWSMQWLFPLLSLNRLTGFLALGSRDLNPEEVELVRTLVNLGGVALHNASLHRKQIEVEESFHRAERVALAGQLAAAAAHEIRNPLTSIRSTVQYVHGSLDEEDRRKLMMKDVLEEVDRINEIVEGLLASVRPKVPTFSRVDLCELLEKIAMPLEQENRFTVVKNLDDNCREAVCDGDQIRQVLLNLVQNAQQAMGDGGQLTLEVKLEGASGIVSRVSPSQYRLVVSDTGPGMSESVAKRVFDPFYTTKGAGGGTGLGLSICRGIIEKHGGEVRVRSAQGQGATFEILLPVNKL